MSDTFGIETRLLNCPFRTTDGRGPFYQGGAELTHSRQLGLPFAVENGPRWGRSVVQRRTVSAAILWMPLFIYCPTKPHLFSFKQLNIPP